MDHVVPVLTLSPRDYDAVLFDLDGVLTRTAAVHAAAWKRLFDGFLRERARATGEPFAPFDQELDYVRYVDGRPRYEGVAGFLAARGVELPWGGREDAPGTHTVCGLGNLKDRYFEEHLARHRVEVFESSIALVRALRARAIKTAVVSSSRHAAQVLEAAGIAALFDARVDGVDAERLELKGKPAPDLFLEAARRLEAAPERTAVVEDALAGVAAGRAGGFACVIGVDRADQAQALRQAGADAVVADLAQAKVEALRASAWRLVYEGFDPEREGLRESLCTLGNGYFATRGAASEAVADGVHYPGTYLACGYNRLRTAIAGRVVESEDLVNLPNWLPLSFRLPEGEWLDLRGVELLSYRRELDIRHGVLAREVRFLDPLGRRTRLAERRIVSMADMHLCAVEAQLTAENWSGSLTVRSAIDARVVNSGAQLYRRFNNRHLEVVGAGTIGDDAAWLEVRTVQSHLHVAQAARTRAFRGGEPIAPSRRTIEEPGYVGEELVVEVRAGETLQLEKVVAFYTSRDQAISECALEARRAIGRADGFDALLARHALAWEHLWDRFDMEFELALEEFPPDALMALRLHMFHLLQTVSPNSIGLDIGVPARGWTGEAYQGHIFWDELFIFPFFNYRVPELTRTLLMYRYRRLPEARAAAKAAGYRGAMFPWQSGSDGSEQTQALNLNPRSDRWMPDHTYLQRHVGAAIAYNVWQYFQVTRDIEFLHFYGAELILDIACFWSSLATLDDARARYEIRGVMGPDEYHDAYPGAASPGLNNNAYTNVMAVWVLCRALEVLELLSDVRRRELTARLEISAEEIARWDAISRKMYVPFHGEGIVSQFEGYEKLAEFDWEGYRRKYGNIQRLDLILEAEDDGANRYKLSKQADVLMLFYLFSSEELGELFGRLGYAFEYETIPRNVEYYSRRSSHGSTLSRVVHAWVLARSDRPRAMGFFLEALQSDLEDIQQGTTREGIHLGAMAGTVDLLQRVCTGIEAKENVLRLNPRLPEALARLDMRVRYRGHSLDLRITRDALSVRCRETGEGPIRLGVRNEVFDFDHGTRVFALK